MPNINEVFDKLMLRNTELDVNDKKTVARAQLLDKQFVSREVASARLNTPNNIYTPAMMKDAKAGEAVLRFAAICEQQMTSSATTGTVMPSGAQFVKGQSAQAELLRRAAEKLEQAAQQPPSNTSDAIKPKQG